MSELTPNGEALSRAEQVDLSVSLVAAFVSRNAMQAGEMPSLLRSVYDAIAGLGVPVVETKGVRAPAVPVRKSVTPSHIVSLIDGKPYRSLKRHIGVHGYTPVTYREAFGLPSDYPMIAVEYAEKRSELAKTMGLGKRASAREAAAA